MKILKQGMAKGKRTQLIELEGDEELIAISPNRFYRLGYPHEDILEGHIVSGATATFWCSIEQKWMTA